MSDLEKQFAEIIGKARDKCSTCQGMPEHYCKGVYDLEMPKQLLSLVKIEIECPKCKGAKVFTMRIVGNRESTYPCLNCNRTGKIIKPIEINDVGKIVG